jgi:translation initiation factor 2 alpha subunit (eIF-2alpha)
MKVYGISTSRHEIVTSTLRNVNIDHAFFYRYIINSAYEVFGSYIYKFNERVNFDSEPLYPFKKIKKFDNKWLIIIHEDIKFVCL